MTRPTVSVIVPYAGDADGARAAAAALGRLALRPGDELLIVDNTPGAIALAALESCRPVRLLHAPDPPGPYGARNAGATQARGEWLLFTDADCIPAPDLLDAYFSAAVDDDVGALAGGIAGPAEQPGLVPAYIRSRRHLDHGVGLAAAPRPMVYTANLLVRARAFAQLGGFAAGVRSGADIELGWRLLEAGWRVELREAASVAHRHRATLPELLRQSARDGAGTNWLARRYPDFIPPSPLRRLPRGLAAMLAWLLAGRLRRAAFSAIDALYCAAGGLGCLSSNGMARPAQPAARVLVAEQWPGGPAPDVDRVEAASRPHRLALVPGPPIAYAEDDGPLPRASALARLIAARPRVLRSVAVVGPRTALALAPAAWRARAQRSALVAGPAATVRARSLATLAGRGQSIG